MAINFSQSLQALKGKLGIGQQPAQQPSTNQMPVPSSAVSPVSQAQSFNYFNKPGGQLKGGGEIVYANGKTWPEMDFMEQWNTAMGVDYRKLVEEAQKAAGAVPPPQFTPPLLDMNHPWISENQKDYGWYKPQGPKGPPPSPGNMQGYVPPTSSRP